MQMGLKKKVGVTILILDKIDLNTKTIKKTKKGII